MINFKIFLIFIEECYPTFSTIGCYEYVKDSTTKDKIQYGKKNYISEVLSWFHLQFDNTSDITSEFEAWYRKYKIKNLLK